MSDNWSIEKKGFTQLEAKLSRMAKPEQLTAAMRDALDVVKQEASRFPPQPSRTRSKHFNTWIREKGAYTIATFKGANGFRKRPNTRAGRLIRPSEKLLRNWKTARPDIYAGAGYIIGKIVNRVSYGQFVQGEKQAGFHAQTGWKTTTQIIRAQQKRIVKVFEDALIRIVER